MWKMLIGRRIQSERPLRRAGLPTRVRYERRLRSIFTNYAPTRAIARPTPSTERAVIMDATRAASQSSCLNSVRIGVLRHIDEFPTFNSCWIVSGQARSMVEILSRRMVFLPQPEPRSPIGPAPALFFPQHLQCVGGPVEQLLRDTRHRPVPHKCIEDRSSNARGGTWVPRARANRVGLVGCCSPVLRRDGRNSLAGIRAYNIGNKIGTQQLIKRAPREWRTRDAPAM